MIAIDSLSRALLNAQTEPSLLVSGKLVVAANCAAAALLGSGMEGKDVRLAIRHPDALELILGGAAGESEMLGIGGAQRPWRVSVQLLGGDLRLVRLADLAAIRSAERMRVDFVANASHELRTPLATVIGYAETLAEEGELPTELRRRFATTIDSEARRMLRMIEELMALSRIEADRYQAPTDKVDLGAIARVAVEQCAELARNRAAVLTHDLAPASIRGDSGQLEQLVTNLLTNAIRYGCNAQKCSVSVEVRTIGPAVELQVRDNGDGIASEHLPRITERFYRVDEARSRDSGGTGLGLAIVKHIAERHRASLDIASAPGAGTTVTLRFPRA